MKIHKKKKKRNRVFSVKKNFKKIKKVNILSIKKKFSFFKINKSKLGLFFKSISKKSFFEINNIFVKSIINILTFFFFFLNKIIIKFLIKKKFIYLNFKSLKNYYINLKNGDFLQFLHIKTIIKFLKFWSRKQRRYFKIIKKKLKKLSKSKKKVLIRNVSSNFPKSFFFFIKIKKKILNIIEFDYLTLSFFFLKKKNLKLNHFLIFNPFIFRLLQYK